jgi:hypothetical protein
VGDSLVGDNLMCFSFMVGEGFGAEVDSGIEIGVMSDESQRAGKLKDETLLGVRNIRKYCG